MLQAPLSYLEIEDLFSYSNRDLIDFGRSLHQVKKGMAGELKFQIYNCTNKGLV